MLNKLTVLLIAPFLAVCHAQSNLLFFEPGSCNEKRNHVSCYGSSPGSCCVIASPFSGSLSCDNCPQGTTTWAYAADSCGATPPNGCTEPGDGAYCCIDLDNAPSCTAIWFADTPAKRDELALRASAADEKGNCTASHEPDKMVFMDDEGVDHEIHMPKGTFTTAAQHFQDGNWAELHKFPAWCTSFPCVLLWT